MNRARRIRHGCVVVSSVALGVSSAFAQPAQPPAAAAAPPHATASPAEPSPQPAETAPAPTAEHPEAATALPKEPAAEPTPAPTPPKETAANPAKSAVVAAPAKDTGVEKEPEPKKGSISSLEIEGAIGPSVVTTEGPADPQYTRSYSRIGLYGEFALSYRSRYFIDPFLSVSYASLASGESVLPAGPWGSGGTLQQHLGVWTFAPGVTADIWRIRLRFGLGVALFVQDYTFLDKDNSTTQLAVSSQFGLGANLIDADRFRLDTELRFVASTGADITFTTLAVVARGDLFQFGTR
jgi:hypothetical protein